MLKQLKPKLSYFYVKALLDIVGRSLVSASQVDAKIQKEIAKFPVGYCFSMNVFSSDLAFYAQVTEQQQLRLLSAREAQQQGVDLEIQFKHLNHAFLVLSFQESTAKAFANDRMIVNGDLAYAVKLVRCLNQLESIILPKVLATLAVKEYPNSLQVKEKLLLAGRIYGQVVKSYLPLKK
ncbi:MAG: hypothetical protein Q4D05_03565 [Acinetobacter sp.]|nr:hypothetical protein [Acinetobacter sp.]